MIVSIWVFFMLGEPSLDHPGTSYVQTTASPWEHEREPEVVEHRCADAFHAKYPGVTVCDSGWCKQSVQVMGE